MLWVFIESLVKRLHINNQETSKNKYDCHDDNLNIWTFIRKNTNINLYPHFTYEFNSPPTPTKDCIFVPSIRKIAHSYHWIGQGSPEKSQFARSSSRPVCIYLVVGGSENDYNFTKLIVKGNMDYWRMIFNFQITVVKNIMSSKSDKVRINLHTYA